MPPRHFRHVGARLQALAHNARLIITRPPPALTAASDPPDINHRVNGRVRLAFRLMLRRMVESIAHGLALSHQPDRLEMWSQFTAYHSKTGNFEQLTLT